jgi:hypothetical protein
MRPIEHTVAITLPTTPEQAFAVIAPIDLPEIFRGFGPLPAVVRVEGQSGPWAAAGAVRHPQFADGGSAVETLVSYDAPRFFAYTIHGFTNALRWLTSGVRGEWWFREQEDGTTLVRWSYGFTPRSAWARPLLWLVVRLLWAGYMRAAIERAGTAVVAPHSQQAAGAYVA